MENFKLLINQTTLCVYENIMQKCGISIDSDKAKEIINNLLSTIINNMNKYIKIAYSKPTLKIKFDTDQR